jgi:hypothetical protein
VGREPGHVHEPKGHEGLLLFFGQFAHDRNLDRIVARWPAHNRVL